MKTYLLLILVCMSVPILLSDQISEIPQLPSLQKDNVVYITIFVHGIMGIKPYLTVPNVVKFVRDKIAHTQYARSVELSRSDPFFHQHHPMQKTGLREIDMHVMLPGAASNAYASIFAKVDSYAGYTTTHRFYTFGWSGLLSPRMRYLEAEIFYNQLMQEFKPYLQAGIPLFVRLICYSHGGNVALKLADLYAQDENEQNKKFAIDQLVLLGVPVLPETDNYIHSPLFKKIYHFYSFGDRVQRLDCFSLNRVFSNRIFKTSSEYKLPQKLVQIHVGIKQPSRKNIKFPETEEERIRMIRNRRCLRTADPGHSELWSFGWTPSGYREKFPLYPLPFAPLTPLIISRLEAHLPDCLHAYVELHPLCERMILYHYIDKKELICHFLTSQQLAEIQKIAYQIMPDNYTPKKYNRHLKKARIQAHKEWLKERRIRRFGRWCYERDLYPALSADIS